MVLSARLGKKNHSLPNSSDLYNILKKKKFLEMPVSYSMTLGEDRLVCAYHVYKTNHGENSPLKRTLVVDAGTFLTIDCVSKCGFEGGFIFPGLQVYLDGYKSGAALPGLSEAVIDEKEVKLPGNTNEAIAESAKIYLQGLFKELIGRFSPSKIILTGGNSKKVATFLSNCGVPVEHHENLVHQSLYTFWSELNSTT